jgi:hypothetical protein
MTKTEKKLALKRETFADLSLEQLSQVVAGTLSINSIDTIYNAPVQAPAVLVGFDPCPVN